MPKISFIIPCYFNEANIPLTSAELFGVEKLFPADTAFEYVFVDDGSGDNTWNELAKLKQLQGEKIKAIRLAGNVGSHHAILAGMHYATGDCNVVIAADLQDPPELIPEMYSCWQQGFKMVVAHRKDREESFLQKLLSNLYHYLIRKLALKNIPPGGFDFTLFDKQLREEAVRVNEKNTNVLYLLAWFKYKMKVLPYVRKKRKVGVSRWTFGKKVKLFIDSFVAFSFAPIRAISFIGILVGLVAFFYGLFVVYAKVTGVIPLEGWSSLMVVVLFVSSFQMIALGIIGEYVWRTLDASRKRPNFIVETVL